jgi:hypothetical protein
MRLGLSRTDRSMRAERVDRVRLQAEPVLPTASDTIGETRYACLDHLTP